MVITFGIAAPAAADSGDSHPYHDSSEPRPSSASPNGLTPSSAGETIIRGDEAERHSQRRYLRLRLEGVLALLKHLLRLGQLSLSAVAALADGDLLLQLGDGVCDAASQGAEDVLGLLCGLFLWDGCKVSQRCYGRCGR